MRSLGLVVLVACSSTPQRPTANHAEDRDARELHVELATGPGGDVNPEPTSYLVAKAGSQFPAISSDGGTVVHLFEDQEDFTGFPISTLVAWSRDGKKLASIRLGGREKLDANAVLREAEAFLGKLRWKPLALHQGEDGDAISTLKLDDTTLTFDTETEHLSIDGKPSDAKFPAPGDLDRGEGCGTIRALRAGFGGRAIGLAIVVPQGSLGGDSCFGKPSADNAIAIRL